MSIKYTNNDDIFISRDENITDVRLNKSLTKLIENDFSISPVYNIEPKIWECRWFSDDNVKGYDKGYAVWLNTEDEDEFLKSKADNIYDCIKKHPSFVNVTEYVRKDPSSREFYHSLLTGYVDVENGRKLPPIYFLGTLSDDVQIKISTKDNNKDTPDTLSSWRDYFIRDFSLIQKEMSAYGDNLFEEHVQEFHFGDANVDTDNYADITLANVTPITQYTNNSPGNSLTGFDYVVQKSHNNQEVSVVFDDVQTQYQYGYNLSVYDYVLDTTQVNRNTAELKNRFTGARNYEWDKIERAIDQLTSDSTLYFVDISFRMVSANVVSESYPYTVQYSQWDSISDVIDRYDVKYQLLNLTDTKQYSYAAAPDYYIQKKPTVVYSDWTTSTTPPDPEQDYEYKESMTQISVGSVHYTQTHNVRVGYDFWASGYLEQYGFVQCSAYQNVKVTLPYSYEYQESDSSFYDLYQSFGEMQYQSSKNLEKEDRYTVQLTQIYSDGYDEDEGIEINTIRNDGFCIYNWTNSTKYYFYTTRGFVSRSSL